MKIRSYSYSLIIDLFIGMKFEKLIPILQGEELEKYRDSNPPLWPTKWGIGVFFFVLVVRNLPLVQILGHLSLYASCVFPSLASNNYLYSFVYKAEKIILS